MVFDPETMMPPGAKIKVIGVGGGGGNAVNTMIRSGLEGVEFITANTDVQSLRFSLAPVKLQIGKELTKGLGAGADPDIGRDAALEDRHEIQEILGDADMVFITAGMGGGTGTGGAAIIAQIARELGALTVAVVTKPFNFEGKRRRKHADLGIARLRECVDTLITIPNQRLLQVATPDLSMIDAFKMADNVLVNAVRGISDIINIPGTVNVDFADVKTVMSSMGHALMGIGMGAGPTRAVDAAKQAICSPLLEDVDIEGATGILVNITAGSTVTLMEVNEACSIIQEAAHEDANFIFGAVIDESIGDAIRVTVIATGFPMEGDERSFEPIQSQVVKPASTIASSFAPFGATRLTTPRPTPSFAPKTQAPQVHRTDAVKSTPSPSATERHAAPSHAPSQIDPFQSYHAPTFIPPSYPTHQTAETHPHEPSVMAPQASPPPPPTQHSQGQASSGFTALVEAQELARLTLGDVPQTAAERVDSSRAQRIEGAWLIRQHDEDFSENTEIASSDPDFDAHAFAGYPSEDRTNRHESTHPASTQSTSENTSSSTRTKDLEPAPLEALFDSDLSVVSEIDQRIDEALALAERLRSNPSVHTNDGDDLDVPAFLRNGIKDLPLG